VLIFVLALSLYRRKQKKLLRKVEERAHHLEEKSDELQIKNQELSHISKTKTEINEVLQIESNFLKDLNLKIEAQAKTLDQKNKQLTSGMKYAKRIQHSLMPSSDFFTSIFPRSAIFFQPKEIVSGDFFWIRSLDGTIIIAEVDCTGHGVSGAFMSMIGITLLNEIIVNRKVYFPSDIFTLLNEELNVIFSKNQFDIEDVDEGMDLTLLVYDTQSAMVHVASAMQNFFVVRDEKIEMFKGDIFSIGGFISRSKKPVYTTHSFRAQDISRVIISSDGLFDQFGREFNDKFGIDRFFNYITITKHLAVDEQISKIGEYFNAWKGSQDQLDDVLVVGIDFTLET
jgi:serine phosphatase RsbU (regulator of sigma subunit)